VSLKPLTSQRRRRGYRRRAGDRVSESVRFQSSSAEFRTDDTLSGRVSASPLALLGKLSVALAEPPQEVSDEKNQQYRSKPYSSTASIAPATVAVEAPTAP
jgi:hypothetical protein